MGRWQGLGKKRGAVMGMMVITERKQQLCNDRDSSKERVAANSLIRLVEICLVKSWLVVI